MQKNAYAWTCFFLLSLFLSVCDKWLEFEVEKKNNGSFKEMWAAMKSGSLFF